MRARLAHVLWIGGGPQAGKTTLSRLLAGKWDLKIYNLDWHAVRDHDRRDGAASAAFARATYCSRRGSCRRALSSVFAAVVSTDRSASTTAWRSWRTTSASTCPQRRTSEPYCGVRAAHTPSR